MNNTSSFSHKVLIAFGIAIPLVLLVLFLGAIFRVILIAIAATLVAAFFRGIGRWLSKKTSIKRGWATLIAVVSFFVVLGGTGWALSPYVSDQVKELDKQLPNSIQAVEKDIRQTSWGDDVINYIEENDPLKQVRKNSGSFFSAVFGIFGVLGDIYIILFMGFLIAASPSPYQEGIMRLVPKSGRKRTKEVLFTLGVTLRSWLAGKLLSMLLVAVFTWAGLTLIDLPLALILGISAGILAFVPNFGPIFALLLGVLVAAPYGFDKILLTAVVYTSAQVLESNFLTPLIMRHQVSLPMAMVLFAQLVLAVFAGVLGLVLATPIFALVMVLIKLLYVEDVLGDKKPLLEPEKKVKQHQKA
ncbi:MAG: AI-2E family transporter [Cyclobacteriaceae bacterium]